MRKNYIKNAVIYLFAALCLLPLVVMVYFSFKGLEGDFSLWQYTRALFFTEDFLRGYWNALFYTGLIILFNVPLSLLSAYGFSQFKFRGNRFLFWLYIVLMLMPFQATIVPQYLTLKAFNLINHPMAVIVPNIFATFGTVLMAQYMRGLGKELFDAGKIDGFSDFHFFLRVATPLCKSLILALTVLSFINYWSMIEQPLVFISDPADMPLAVSLNTSGQFRGLAFAIGVIFSVLPLLLYQLAYRDLVFGIRATSGAGGVQGQEGSASKNKSLLIKCIIGFLLLMGFSTLATQKIAQVQLSTVEVMNPESKDVKLEYFNQSSPSQGYFTYVLPNTAIYREGADSFVYTVERERSKTGRLQLLPVRVEVRKSNEVESALSGSLTKDSWVVIHSERPPQFSRFVRLYDRDKTPALKEGVFERVDFLIPEDAAQYLEQFKGLEGDVHEDYSAFIDPSEPNRVIVEGQTGRYDPFLGAHFLEAHGLHEWLGDSRVIMQDYTHLGTVVEDLSRFKWLVLYTLCFVLTLYALYQFLTLQILWFKEALQTQYVLEILKGQAVHLIENGIVFAIGIGLSAISFMKMVGFKFFVTANDLEKFKILKGSMIDSEAVLSDYAQACFELLGQKRFETLLSALVMFGVFLGLLLAVKLYAKRKRLKYGKSFLS